MHVICTVTLTAVPAYLTFLKPLISYLPDKVTYIIGGSKMLSPPGIQLFLVLIPISSSTFISSTLPSSSIPTFPSCLRANISWAPEVSSLQTAVLAQLSWK